jgi:hypothetical protein
MSEVSKFPAQTRMQILGHDLSRIHLNRKIVNKQHFVENKTLCSMS